MPWNPHGIVLVDKPRGLTSHDVVALVRRRLSTRRVGHAGTLDPAAEGLLIVAVGRSTKLIPSFQSADKRYIAHVVLGVGSETDDIEGPLRTRQTMSAPEPDAIERAMTRFRGPIEQVPPAYSALKRDGQPLYRLARRGLAPEIPARPVTIYELRLLSYAYPDLLLDVHCSSGTYIRSLARDLGDVLGQPAYLHALLRTSTGPAQLASAWSLTEIEQHLSPATWSLMALHADWATVGAVALVLGPGGEDAWYHGRPVPGELDLAATSASAYSVRGSWLGLARADRSADVWHPNLVVAKDDARSD